MMVQSGGGRAWWQQEPSRLTVNLCWHQSGILFSLLAQLHQKVWR
jgi:hypothetical protein